ncbi:LysR substrate-binding domain-containing protein [Acidovorax radicis]|uniref:LysR substrate-binding domain-containing protein n=1 Tax=Acidovorax radicis TaxID=758826 RepID=UPI0002377FB7|nr:LysR substrate-binding domain-containing protein [Acidovorax radicis]
MSHRLPPLSALRAFEAAARLGRMTAAADELSVTPGAISRQVRQLEQHLGVALFDGSKARPTLTPAAHVLQPVLTHAFAHIADAVREVSDPRRGPLDVACFSTFTVKWLIPRLFDFQAQHPGIEVRLRTTDAGTDAKRQHGDLVITAEEASGARDASREQRLFAEHLGPVLSPELAQRVALQQPADLADPAVSPLRLHTRTRRNAWAMWGAAAGAAAPEPVPVPTPSPSGPEFEHYYFTLEAAVRGLGIAVAPWHLVMDDVLAGRLVAPLGFVASGYDYVVRRRASGPLPRLDVFCAWLQAQAAATPAPPGPQQLD